MKRFILPFVFIAVVKFLNAQCEDFVVSFKEADSVDRVLICSPSSVLLEQQCKLNVGDEIVEYNWSFGDGRKSSLENPAHTYIDAGVYGIKMNVRTKNGCFDSLYIDSFFTVLGPKAQFSLANDTVCKNSELTVIDNSKYHLSNAPIVIWKFSDGDVISSSKSESDTLSKICELEGSHTIRLSMTQKVRDPHTGIVKDCADIYPNLSASEPAITYVVKDIEQPQIDENGGKPYLINRSDYDSVIWNLNGKIIKTDTVELNGIAYLDVQVFKNGCSISIKDVFSGIGDYVKNNKPYLFSYNQNVLNFENNSKEALNVRVYSANGQLIYSSVSQGYSRIEIPFNDANSSILFLSVSNKAGFFKAEIFKSN